MPMQHTRAQLANLHEEEVMVGRRELEVEQKSQVELFPMRAIRKEEMQ